MCMYLFMRLCACVRVYTCCVAYKSHVCMAVLSRGRACACVRAAVRVHDCKSAQCMLRPYCACLPQCALASRGARVKVAVCCPCGPNPLSLTRVCTYMRLSEHIYIEICICVHACGHLCMFFVHTKSCLCVRADCAVVFVHVRAYVRL